ncbi:MAG: transposase [Verrucomicrobiaceae bacterium]|nr:transposase [Verrucomicrobiaceae bacterium]
MEKTKLKDVCDRITVGYVGPMADEYTPEGITFLRSQNITPFRLNLEDVKFIPAAFYAKIKKSALKPGDVAVVRTGYPGTACVIPESLPDSNCADLVVITPSKELNSFYLAAIFNSAWGMASVRGNLVGVAQQHFNVGAAKEMEVTLPPRAEQDRIAGILSAYDELMENSQRRIRLLEDMARALYREWFVHFRFPGHDSVPRLPSALGDIPQGWEVKTAPECIDFNPRVTVPREGEKPFLPMGCLATDSMIITDIESRAGNSGSKFQNGDTLFARITPCLENGKTGFVQFLPNASAVAFGSTEFIVMRSRTLTPEFVYCLARSDEFRGNAIKRAPLETSFPQEKLSPGALISHVEGHESLPQDPARRRAFQRHRTRAGRGRQNHRHSQAARAYPWESFRPLLEELTGYATRDWRKGGKPPFDPVLMLKVLVLQKFHGLSDDATEEQIFDRTSFKSFLGLRIGDVIPDAKTIWDFKQRLEESGREGSRKLFDAFNLQLEAQGYIAREGSIIDASFTRSPAPAKQPRAKPEHQRGRAARGVRHQPSRGSAEG